MNQLIRIYDEFYKADNVAGVLGSEIITCDNPQLHTIQGDPAFLEFSEYLPFSKLYCEYCHSELKGDVCYSCGASYERNQP